MPVVAFLEKQAKRIAMPRGPRQIAWIILLLAAGWFDYITGPEVASAPFYILILVLLAIVEPWGACLGYSFLAACISLTVDLYTTPARAFLVFPYWATTSRFLGFALISIAISLLVAERRRLQQAERALQDRSKELEEKNRRIEETLRTVTRLQEERLTRERQNDIAEAISTAVYEMERPLASVSIYVEEVVRLMTRVHEADNLHLVLDAIQPLAEKLAERVRDMQRIVEDVRSLRKSDPGDLAGPGHPR
jgi:signal transduction histidine kinase